MLSTIARSVAAVLISASASFAAVSWTPSSGSTANYTYEGGQTEEERFTFPGPDVVGDTFLFNPTGFVAEERDGATFDGLQFAVTAKPGKSLGRISAGLAGDWSLAGSGNVNSFGTLTLTNANDLSDVRTYQLAITPSMPNTAEDGNFTGLVSNIAFPSNWTTALVRLDAGVGIDVDEGSTGAIQLKAADITLQAAAVPLPGALAAVPFAAGVAWWVRRKKA